MNENVLNFLTSVYRLLLRLYPADFREKFGEEMAAVFAWAVAEITQTKPHRLIVFCGRELRDYPLALLREYWRQFSQREANLILKRERLVWIHEEKWLWRTAVLYLLGFAMIGPWGYDRLHVPSPFDCSGFNIRLDENFCGMPVSLARFFFSGEFTRLATRLVTGAIDSRELFPFLLMLLAALPFLSTLVLILFGNRRHWRALHLVILGLVTSAVLSWLLQLFAFSPASLLAAWGAWLYLALAIGGLVSEFWTLGRNRGLAHE
jgi:hypothetical protein